MKTKCDYKLQQRKQQTTAICVSDNITLDSKVITIETHYLLVNCVLVY